MFDKHAPFMSGIHKLQLHHGTYGGKLFMCTSNFFPSFCLGNCVVYMWAQYPIFLPYDA